MHTRRTYLLAIAGATTAGLAGCGGDGGGGASPTAATTTDGNPEEARAHYDDAIETLVENHETIMDWAEGRTAGRDGQAVQTLRDDVASARESLGEAEAVAPSDFEPRIGHARDAAALQEAIAGYHAVVIDFEAAIADAEAFADSEQNAEAIEQFEAAKTRLDEARSRLDEIETAHEALDSEALDEPELDYSGRYTHYVGLEAPETLDARELSVDGRIHLNRAFVELRAGDQHYQAEEFAQARQRFEAGAAALRRSEEAFTAVQEHEYAYQSLRQGAIQVLGLLDDLQAAFDRFVDSAAEAEAGNVQQANDLRAEGFSLLQDAFEG